MRRNPNTKPSIKIFLPPELHDRLRIAVMRSYTTTQVFVPAIEAQVADLERQIALKDLQEAS